MGKPIPDEPIPHDNLTGDLEFQKRRMDKDFQTTNAFRHLIRALVFDFIKLGNGSVRSSPAHTV